MLDTSFIILCSLALQSPLMLLPRDGQSDPSTNLTWLCTPFITVHGWHLIALRVETSTSNLALPAHLAHLAWHLPPTWPLVSLPRFCPSSSFSMTCIDTMSVSLPLASPGFSSFWTVFPLLTFCLTPTLLASFCGWGNHSLPFTGFQIPMEHPPGAPQSWHFTFIGKIKLSVTNQWSLCDPSA